MEEIWRSIPEYEYYQASSFGRIRGIYRIIKLKTGRLMPVKAHILTLNKGKTGYLTVNIRGTRAAHRLICASFHKKKAGFNIVEHIDDNKLNLVPSNLRWSTKALNFKSAVSNGRIVFRKGELSPRSKLRNSDVLAIRKLHLSGMTPSEISMMYNITTSNVCNIAAKRIWKHL